MCPVGSVATWFVKEFCIQVSGLSSVKILMKLNVVRNLVEK